MLGLKLRDEFLGSQMPGTAIELRRNDNQGAAQKTPDHLLAITYPTEDVQIALAALSKDRAGLPVVLVGERGRGKSHIMAVMHHALAAPGIVEPWLHDWGNKLCLPKLARAELVKGYLPISESMLNNEFHFLWDLLFDRHPQGQYYRGQFESLPQSFPPRTLLEKMFAEQPVCLILDEFQSWFNGLPETDPKTGTKIRQYAFNFIQVLSEIAKDRPEIFILVVSVLDTNSNAYQQVHRQGPIAINFRGAAAKRDRQNLLLHRLFENRSLIQLRDIEKTAAPYAGERFRLLFPGKSAHEKDGALGETAACWPFSPELIDLLEDHILMSSSAQNTRDLIRILAKVYKSRGEAVPVITPADFFVDGNREAAHELVTNVANQDVARLIEVAQRNLTVVRNAGADVTHDREMVSAVWMYSLTLGLKPGVDAAKLHLAVTRNDAIDDNAFQAELARLVENSVNIHGDGTAGSLLRFEAQENPRSKVKAYAKNAKLWDASALAAAGQPVYPGKDVEHIRKTLKAIFVPETQASATRVIVLGPNWRDDPWSETDEADRPGKWDKPVLLVIPEKFGGDRAAINETLGAWLARQVPKRRNTVRFLLSGAEAGNLFQDRELVFQARCSYLCSKNAWGAQDRAYSALFGECDRPLRGALRARFIRFAILRTWDFRQAKNCVFDLETLTAQGGDIPEAVEQKIRADLFDRTDFQNLVLACAKNGDFVGSLFDDLAEAPPPGRKEAIPFLGEIRLYDHLLELAAEGKIALNVGGSWISRRPEDASAEDALRHIKSRAAFRGRQENRQVQLGLPGAVGGGAITAQPMPAPAPAAGTGISPVPPAGPKAPPFGSGAVNEPPDPSAVRQTRTRKTETAAGGLNLSGCFEKWGIAAAQEIKHARLEFSGLTAQQIKQILQHIPSVFMANLEVTYDEGEGQ
ncbi:MAG: DUF499 domain-containing protein [Planctomycetota bacterium]|jgi:hypothetical protein|nr:DUF499 domain-containing protein [Planctomycetota bacterium]